MTPLLADAAIGGAASVALAFLVWLLSLKRDDVSIVDIAWGALVLLPGLVVALRQPGPRAPWLVALVAAWALRLGVHIAWRHRGQPEDRRYQEIRRRNQPHFEWKSLYLVFGLQALLAWIVAAPVMAAAASREPLQGLDAVGACLALAGLAFEAVADAQLARFTAAPAHKGQVMKTGLWRYSRHPNYFGECCLWWGLWLVALSAGAGWTVFSPLLMTVLLLKVSGVTLLERHLASSRFGYADYVRRTNAFIPGRPKR